MADLLQEADDALRQEKLAKFWNDNGAYIIGFVIFTIVLTGAISVYRSWDYNVREDQTARVLELEAAPDYPDNILAQEDLDLRSGLREMAMMSAAATYVEQGDKDKALEMYKRVEQDSGLDLTFRQLATLMIIRLQTAEENYDSDPLIDALEEVATDKDSPWRWHALLELSVLEAHNNEYKDAQEHLNTIMKAQDLPPNLYAKASALMQVYKGMERDGKSAQGDE